jgi:chromosome segregation ATPase
MYEEQKYDHLLIQPSSALLGLIKERKYDNVRNFVNQAASNVRVLHKHLATKTRRLDQSIAENQRLFEQNKDLVRRRTDMARVDALSHELAEVKRAAAADRMRLTELMQDTDMQLQVSKSNAFASEQRIGTLKMQNEVLEIKMKRLEEENRRLQTECIRHAELKIDNARLQTEHVVLQCKNEELKEKCLFLESTSALRADQHMGYLKSENLVLQMEYGTLKTQNNNLKTETDLLKEQNESLNRQVEIADCNLRASKTLVSQQREDLRSLRMRVKTLEEANQARSEQIYSSGVSLETVLSNNNLQSILCPITMDLMTDPVMAEDNHTYSRAAFERHIRTSGTPFKSPMTNAAMGTSYKPNWAMKGLLEELGRFMPRVGAKTSESA